MGNPVVHFEIGCQDLHKTKEFYSAVFNWRSEAYGPTSAMITTGAETGINGHFNALGHEPHKYVNIYIQVDDLQNYLDQINKSGGRTLIPPQQVGEVGAFAWFEDPAGNTIGLWKSATPNQ
ncbi:MAG: hypothetical protein HJJLKODD_02090 [Phycisphaerae bacterium]|nr:hypothetical protein [Phycisphaerae bacterium]